MKTPALSVSNLRIWFESGSNRNHAVDNISFNILPGEATGLVGESGCGKSMTALAILGLLPAAGIKTSCSSIKVNGIEISRLSQAQRRDILGRDIAMIFQQPGTALDPVFTIGSLIGATYRRHFGGSKQVIRQAVCESLESVGFKDPGQIAATYPHQLSGGMRQLAMIAMATICKPAVIIADEPTTSLDSATRSIILQQLARLQKSHQTAVLMISHDLGVIRQNCNQVLVMYCGRLVEKTDSQHLFAHARHPYSAGLVSCIPQINVQQGSSLASIPGQVPTADRLPPGCHFAPRCTRARPVCDEAAPELDDAQGVGVACFRPLS